MTFELRLRNDAEAIEAVLQYHLEQERLGANGVPIRLIDAMRHGVLGPGKRIRPFLVMSGARLFGVPADVAAEAAAAVELIHCYSLIHDDLPAMDNDRLRRGNPSVWAAFDEWTAILAGDALLTLAFEILTGPRLELEASRKVLLVSRLAQASGAAGMVGGQQLDLDVAKLHLPVRPTVCFIEQMQARKTGALLMYSAEAGGILGGATPEQCLALRRYGQAVGLAFQIADDLLDVEGDATTVGKAVAKDAEAGKATLIELLGVNEARARLNRLANDAVAALQDFDHAADVLREAASFVTRRSR